MGKIAVILGVGKGIGRAITYSFVNSGATVYFVCRRKHEGEKFLTEIRNVSKAVYFLNADCSRQDEVDKLKEKILSNESCIDFLIINTGRWISKMLEEHTDEDYDELVNSNFKTHFLVYRSFAEQFKKQKCGMIFVVIGIYGTRFIPKNQSIYNATKAACLALSKSFAQEMAPYGVKLFIINPCMTPHNIFSKDPAQKLETDINLNRDGVPEDVALLISRIASFPQIFSTGAVFEVAGIKSSTIF